MLIEHPQLQRFLDLVTTGPTTDSKDEIFNPWRDYDIQNDIAPASPAHRLDHLTRYLMARLERARLLVIAEAPGYAGAKFSGLAMTSERDLIASGGLFEDRFFDGTKQRTSYPKPRLKNQQGMLERTASIVWSSMLEAGFDSREFVLWNCHAWHPHLLGQPLTNRFPRTSEMEHAVPVLRAFLDIFPERPILAVGQLCQRTLASLNITALAVRHPSYGGATEFRKHVHALRDELRAN